MTCKELFAPGNQGWAVIAGYQDTWFVYWFGTGTGSTSSADGTSDRQTAQQWPFPVEDYYLEPAAACGTYAVPLTRDEQEDKMDQVAAAQAEPPCSCDLYSILLRYGCQCGSVQRYDGGLR